MPVLRTFLVALIGLALPVGLALAIYFSSASTIAANPVSLPASAVGKGNPDALDDKAKPKQRKHEGKKEHSRGAPDGTTTADDRGGTTTSGGSDDSSSSGSGSGISGSGSDDRSGSGTSGSGDHSGSGGSDDSGGDD